MGTAQSKTKPFQNINQLPSKSQPSKSQTYSLLSGAENTYVAIAKHYVSLVKINNSFHPHIQYKQVVKNDCIACHTFDNIDDLIITTLHNAYKYLTGILSAKQNSRGRITNLGVLIFGGLVFFELDSITVGNIDFMTNCKQLTYDDVREYMDIQNIKNIPHQHSASCSVQKYSPSLDLYNKIINCGDNKIMIAKSSIKPFQISGVYYTNTNSELVKL